MQSENLDNSGIALRKNVRIQSESSYFARYIIPELSVLKVSEKRIFVICFVGKLIWNRGLQTFTK